MDCFFNVFHYQVKSKNKSLNQMNFTINRPKQVIVIFKIEAKIGSQKSKKKHKRFKKKQESSRIKQTQRARCKKCKNHANKTAKTRNIDCRIVSHTSMLTV